MQLLLNSTDWYGYAPKQSQTLTINMVSSTETAMNLRIQSGASGAFNEKVIYKYVFSIYKKTTYPQIWDMLNLIFPLFESKVTGSSPGP